MATRSTSKYYLVWRNKWLAAKAKDIAGMVAALREAADRLEAMQKDGVQVGSIDGVVDDYIELVTDNPEVAARYRMTPDEI